MKSFSSSKDLPEGLASDVHFVGDAHCVSDVAPSAQWVPPRRDRVKRCLPIRASDVGSASDIHCVSDVVPSAQ